MSARNPLTIDPELDLVLERFADIPPELVWEAWTRPEHLQHWFCPRPWSLVGCEIDLRPGGVFRTAMCTPEGDRLPPSDGCYLDVVEHSRLVWTSALGAGFRPLPLSEDALAFTAHVLLEPEGQGTRYTAIAVHPDQASRERHEALGFHEGWAVALDQLVAHMQAQVAGH